MSVSMSTKEISSVSVELVLHFNLFKELDIAPLPKVARLLVCSLQSSWIWCDPPTYQCTAYFVWSAQSISLRFLVPFKYFKICFSFSQSSLSGDCTLVVRKDTAVWISRCTQLAAKSSWYAVWWKASAISWRRPPTTVPYYGTDVLYNRTFWHTWLRSDTRRVREQDCWVSSDMMDALRHAMS